MFVEPTDTSDQIKITDIDSIPGTYKVMAAGTWYDQNSSKYVIFVMKINDQGESHEMMYAFSLTGSYILSQMPEPKLHYTGNHYLLHFKDPLNGDRTFMCQQSEDATSMSSLLLVDLPSNYQGDDYQIGFVDGTAAIASNKY